MFCKPKSSNKSCPIKVLHALTFALTFDDNDDEKYDEDDDKNDDDKDDDEYDDDEYDDDES